MRCGRDRNVADELLKNMHDEQRSFLFLFIFFFFFFHLVVVFYPVASDPQTHLLAVFCNSYKAANDLALSNNLDAVFSDIRTQIISSSAHFATAQRPHVLEPVYALFQCRDYLSSPDCLSCFNTASSTARNNCSFSSGSTIYYDGCSLRYESDTFYDEATLPSGAGYCEDRTVEGGEGAVGRFNSTAVSVLRALVDGVPRLDGRLFAAVKQGVEGGGAVYGVGQCVLTVGGGGCRDCMQTAYGNVEGCLPAAEGRAADAGCFLRYSDMGFFNDSQAVDLQRLLQSGNGSKKKNAIVIGGAAGGAALLVSFLLLFFFLRRRSKDVSNRLLTGSLFGPTELRGPTNFLYNDLKSATKNFSGENKLGEGGFGDVYKGVLKTGKIVAVKKLMISETSEARANFESEVRLISNVHHRNLVRLLGCSSKGPELLLVYEYMAKSSLDKFIFGDKRGTLDWKQRFDIIVGTARGIAYLHEEFHVCIIHRDIKASNILLDDELQARIADFGLARLLPGDRSHLSTKVAGTLGYTAPEYVINGQLSEKVDTYSFGVVVLEIISGRRSNDVKVEPITEYLLEWAWRLYESDSLMELVDNSLDPESYIWEEVRRVTSIGLMCTQSASLRPPMSEVVVLLLSNVRAEFELNRPPFITGPTYRVYSEGSTSTHSTSKATMSVSQFSAR